MKNALITTRLNFESSSGKTPQYLSWFRLFKREFTKFLTDNKASNIELGKPNHFDMSGFFTLNNQIWYFRIEDLRWSKDNMLLRTAKSNKDYTGGQNQYVNLFDETRFIESFHRITKRNTPNTSIVPLVDRQLVNYQDATVGLGFGFQSQA